MRFAVLAASMLGTGLAHAHTLDAGAQETVQVPTATYTDFRQVLAREAPTATVTVPAALHFPDDRKDRYPAVVVVHTFGGYQGSNGIGLVRVEYPEFANAYLQPILGACRLVGTEGPAFPNRGLIGPTPRHPRSYPRLVRAR
jgi:hypothetical protein